MHYILKLHVYFGLFNFERHSWNRVGNISIFVLWRDHEKMKILGSVKLHIGDSWGRMKTFALGHFYGETQILGESFALEHVFEELQPFFPFSIMADNNFPFLPTLRKPETQTLGGVGNLEFCSRTHFWGATAIFPIFHNGWQQFSISVDTRKTGDPNFRGVGNWEFCSRKCFGELQPFCPFSIMADTNVPTLGKLEWPFCTYKEKWLTQIFHWFSFPFSFPTIPYRFISTFRRGYA